MKGVLLAGGRGTRLGDSTKVVNKHALPVYNRPMITLPVKTLRGMGCDDILVISSPDGVAALSSILGPGFTYRVQREPNGVAGALACAEGYVADQRVFPVILGDNYFEDHMTMPSDADPAIYLRHSVRAHEFGVYDSEARRIVEKPVNPPSNVIVTGLYVYDSRVFDVIRSLTPSRRGELEITDVNNWYLRRQHTSLQYVGGMWSDMGTPDSLLEVATRLREEETT